MSTRIYLAARYSRRLELCVYADDLTERGLIVTSRWLAGSHQVSDDGLSAEASAVERERFAREDWEDVRSADVLIAFSEEPRVSNSRGGRHVEFGAALAWGKRVLVVGPRENVFMALPEVIVCSTWQRVIDGQLWQVHKRDGRWERVWKEEEAQR